MKNLLLLLVVFFFTLGLKAQISGNVFLEYPVQTGGLTANNYGQKDANEIGLEGITVTVFNNDGTNSGPITTNSNGNWSYNGANFPVRVEFTWKSDFPYYEEGPFGSGSLSSVQFINSSSSNVNFGLHYPDDYCQEDPLVVIPAFGFANPARYEGSGLHGLIGFNYSERGGFGTPDIFLAEASDIGAVYGLAYDKVDQVFFTSAFFKNETGLGPGNVGADGSSGAIYKIDLSGNVSVLLDIDPSLGGTHSSGANSHPNTTTNFFCEETFRYVGKRGWGDLCINPEESVLYGMNLFERALYQINSNTGAVISKHTIPGINGGPIWNQNTCTNDPETDLRPFALKYYKGKVYVGITCTAESTDERADLHGYVFEFDPTTNQYSTNPVLDFSIFDLRDNYNAWWPESDDSPSTGPTPNISDIEFIDGDMIISIRSRGLDITSNRDGDKFGPDCVEDIGSTNSAGSLFRACGDINTGWTIESNGTCGGQAGFNNEYYYEQDVTHSDDFLGSTAVLPGAREVVATAIPGSGHGGSVFISDDVFTWEQVAGLKNDYQQRYTEFSDVDNDNNPDFFGKANGLGDVELLCDISPIEIGNLVWEDTNNNGIQDPSEPGISGIPVELVQNGSVIATATTDANGNYIFSSAPGTSTSNFIYGVDQLTYNSSYTLRFPTTSGTYNLTSANTGSKDRIDSDANSSGIVTVLTTDISMIGANNHTFDVGYFENICDNPMATLIPIQGTCDNSVPNDDASINISNVNNGDEANYSIGASYSGPNYQGAGAIDVSSGSGSITGLMHNTQYTVRIFNGAEDCFTDFTVTTLDITCEPPCPDPNCFEVRIITENN